MITAHDGLIIYGRSDAVLNPGGVRIGTAEIYSAVERLPDRMLLGDAVGTVIYALLADYSGATFTTREARINFAAGIDLYANSLQMVLQLVLTRPLMVRFGPAAAMAMDGALKAIMGPLLPSIRPAPTTPAQFTSRFR